MTFAQSGAPSNPSAAICAVLISDAELSKI
jgi:hypothetical protein